MQYNKNNLLAGLVGLTVSMAVLYFAFRVAGAGWAKGAQTAVK